MVGDVMYAAFPMGVEFAGFVPVPHKYDWVETCEFADGSKTLVRLSLEKALDDAKVLSRREGRIYEIATVMAYEDGVPFYHGPAPFLVGGESVFEIIGEKSLGDIVAELNKLRESGRW